LEALEARYKNRQADDAVTTAYSPYPNKQITTGEGGMIVTDDEQAASLMLVYVTRAALW
jgi:dTDP-4-amino-4,6-dideoxygalactose transaminase